MNKIEIFLKQLKNYKFILPPLSGYTDFPYREILSIFKPPFTCTEMIKSRALFENNKKTIKMLLKEKGNHLKGVQLLGNNPSLMKEAAIKIEKMRFDYIDINMGCIVKKVASKGEGISLMKDENLASEICKAVSSSVNLPVTAKVRISPGKIKIDFLSFAKKLEESGIAAITIHGRSGEKKFEANVNYEIIKASAELLNIPVIANGGIFSGSDALKVLEYTKVQAVMPGRALLGNPWIIEELKAAFQGKQFTPPKLNDKKEIFLMHYNNMKNFYGQKSSLFKIRKILPWYFSNIKNAKLLRIESQKINSEKDLFKIIDNIKEENGQIVFVKP